MNLSGGSIAALRGFYKLPADRILAIHDELDLDFGIVRVKTGGGENGHNGLRSVSSSLGTRDYHRLRIGIGRPPGRMDPAAFVLRDFSSSEKAHLPELLDRAADMAEALVSHGVAATQKQFH
jgi:PTH1 family peptidyl-tRNA hydrolase